MLPDDILIKIFDFHVDEDIDKYFKIQRSLKWMTLVHVCRRWRIVVFQSPRRLNLRLICTPETPLRDTLDIWPPLPLDIRDIYQSYTSVDNTISFLELNDRVRQIIFSCSEQRMEYIMDSMALYKPFPELTHLSITTFHCREPILPNSFLAGTAPRLRSLELSIPFPGLPKLLLSATRLVTLGLHFYSPTGYIPLDVMATSLSALTSLKFLRIYLPSPRFSLERHPPPLTPSILPTLTIMLFGGDSGYLEEFLAWIDAPQLNVMLITFDNEFISDTPQLLQFISRRPTIRAPKVDHIGFGYGPGATPSATLVKFPSQTSDLGLLMQIPCATTELELSSIEEVVTSSLPPIPMLKKFFIRQHLYSRLQYLDNIEKML